MYGWALMNCPDTCDICNVECKDKLTNCDAYLQSNKGLCTSGDGKQWAYGNCMKSCKLAPYCTGGGGGGSNPTPNKPITAKPKPACGEGGCVDKETWCGSMYAEKGNAMCTGLYRDWASNTCRKTCDLCGKCDPKSSVWCGMDCWNSMCKYKGIDTAKCTGLFARGDPLSEEAKTEILEAHNKLRRKVSNGKQEGMPAATKAIPDLEWDDDLAKLAQRWMDQCIYKHDTARKTCKFDMVGQNIAQATSWSSDGAQPSSAAPWKSKAIDPWYSEVKYYVKYGLDPKKFQDGKHARGGAGLPQGEEVGHFTQVIWAKTTHVGCGYVYYKVGEDWTVNMACNYGPGGNMDGEAIYE